MPTDAGVIAIEFKWCTTIKIAIRVCVFVITVFAFALIALLVTDYLYRDHTVAYILNLERLPETAKVQDCESPVTTDIITVCKLMVDPKEFPTLVSGYKYIESKKVGSSHVLVGPKLGDEFVVDREYAHEFTDGIEVGYVRVLTDMKNKNVLVDYYIE